MVSDAPAPDVIDVHGLVKRYGRRAAVDGLDLTVGAGEVFGFLGPNGAGKTTTVRMLLGLARPSAGGGTLLGRPLGDPEARREIGYLPENVHFPGWFTGLGFLRYHGALYGLPRHEVDARASEALERLALGGRGGDHLRGYSHGMLQRLGLAQALLNRPRLVFLDEPTSALDPRGRRAVRELLDELRAAGTTVFLNSHLLSEVERTCDRVAIVADGRTRYLGPTRPDGDGNELDVVLEDTVLEDTVLEDPALEDDAGRPRAPAGGRRDGAQPPGRAAPPEADRTRCRSRRRAPAARRGRAPARAHAGTARPGGSVPGADRRARLGRGRAASRRRSRWRSRG